MTNYKNYNRIKYIPRKKRDSIVDFREYFLIRKRKDITSVSLEKYVENGLIHSYIDH